MNHAPSAEGPPVADLNPYLQRQCDPRRYLRVGERPRGFFVGVPAMAPYLVGRETWMEALVARLTSDSSRCVALEGGGGEGKTLTAVALAHRREVLECFCDGVLWARLGRGEQADPVRVLVRWMEALGGDASDAPRIDELSRRVRGMIGQQRLLLVIDDIWDLEMSRALCCGGPNCCHLLTTRDVGIAQHLAGPEGTVSVVGLDDEEAFELLESWAPEACAADSTVAHALARAVDGVPLALELLGGYLRASERRLFADSSPGVPEDANDPEQRLACAKRWSEAHGGKLTLQETVELSLETLPQEAVRTLYALDETASRSEHFHSPIAEMSDEAGVVVPVILAARNLVQVEGGVLTLHQAVADVMRQEGEEGRAKHRSVKCTIGIMAYNEAANIGRLLDALLRQKTRISQIERIIVVASGCTDGTEDIVDSYVVRDPRLTLLRQAQREGKASAVNLFMRHARAAEVIVLSSADLLPELEAIEALVSPFADPTTGMVGGHPIPTNLSDTFMGFGINLLWDLHHRVSLRCPKMGELIAFRNIFRQIPPDTAVDEASIEPLIIGQGLKLHYSPEAIVYNHGPETVRDFIKQRRRIYTGHLYVKDTLGYQVSTMKGMRILSVLLQSLKPNLRYFAWTLAIVALEVFVRALGVYDYRVRKRNPFVWQMAESTKKGLIRG